MRFLVADPQPELQDWLASRLRQGWRDCSVLCAGEGRTALEYFQRFEPDLVLLDAELPNLSGTEVLQAIRRTSDVPVIVYTSRVTEIEQVRLLSLGADDVVGKPSPWSVLQARIRSLLRRTEAMPHERGAPTLVAGDLTIDLEHAVVTLRGEPVRLTPMELRLLLYLARNAGRVLLHQDILNQVWGEHFRASPAYLKVFISRVRAKIQPDPDSPPLIENQRGIGYRFVRPSDG